MSFYSIKCVHCMRIIPNEEVVYRLSTSEFDGNPRISEATPKSGDLSDSADKFESDDVVSSHKTGEFNFDVSDIGSDDSGFDEYVTGEKLRELAASAEPVFAKEIKVSQKVYKDQLERGQLILGYDVKGVKIEGQYYDGRMNVRRCPYCRGRLLKDAGRYPIFNLVMIGHSTAGKTVLLTMQHVARQQGLLNMSVYGGRVFTNYQKGHLEVEDTITSSAKNFSKTGIFPPTTEVVLPPPHCIQLSYRQYRPSAQDKDGVQDYSTTTCIFSFQDVKGEALTAQTDEKEVYARCERADGCFVLTDPLALKIPSEKIPQSEKHAHQQGRQAILDLCDSLHTNVFTVGSEAVRKPCVCVLTKEDELHARASVLGIAADEPAIATGQPTTYKVGQNWYKEVFFPLTTSTWDCLKRLDGAHSPWCENIQTMFTNAVHFPVSSIGSKVRIIDIPKPLAAGEILDDNDIVNRSKDRKLATIQEEDDFLKLDDREKVEQAQEFLNLQTPISLLNPRGLELPLLYFMMKFKMIPPMDEESFYQIESKPSKFLKFLKSNCSQEESEKMHFQQWLEEYAQNDGGNSE